MATALNARFLFFLILSITIFFAPSDFAVAKKHLKKKFQALPFF